MTIVVAETEALLCAILHKFESLALRQYQDLVPEAANGDKHALIARLRDVAPDDAPLSRSDLDDRIETLISLLTASNRRVVLINQGFLMEFVGKAIYAAVGEAKDISRDLRDVCAIGAAAGETTRAAVLAALKKEFPRGEDFLSSLVELSPEVLKQLDPLSEGLDRHFGAAFGLNFGDLIGDFVSEIDETASNLGADRRKLVGFLTHVMMEL